MQLTEINSFASFRTDIARGDLKCLIRTRREVITGRNRQGLIEKRLYVHLKIPLKQKPPWARLTEINLSPLLSTVFKRSIRKSEGSVKLRRLIRVIGVQFRGSNPAKRDYDGARSFRSEPCHEESDDIDGNYSLTRGVSNNFSQRNARNEVKNITPNSNYLTKYHCSGLYYF